MAEAQNFFHSPVGLADFAILHEARKWNETQRKSLPDPDGGEFSTGLVIGNEDGQHFKTIVDGMVQKKLTEEVEKAFADLKKNKPKKVAKYKSAMEWQTAENVFSCYYPYQQVEDDEGEALDAWKFKFKKKALIKYKDKKTGKMEEFRFFPKFRNKEGDVLEEDYFQEKGLIGNESEMRIRYKPYAWSSPKNEVGVKLELDAVQLVDHVPYKSKSNGSGNDNDNEPLFPPF